jgi:hypothetical protein
MKPGIYYSMRLDQLLILWEVFQKVITQGPKEPHEWPNYYIALYTTQRCGIAVESGWRPTLLIGDEEFDELMCEWVGEL